MTPPRLAVFLSFDELPSKGNPLHNKTQIHPRKRKLLDKSTQNMELKKPKESILPETKKVILLPKPMPQENPQLNFPKSKIPVGFR